ncbi:MAG: hypothetical protein J6Y85_05625 [Alphaproteobacteria bacterium]|nr:hypothetical protein [Alphaproteobacteria bacterium]
MDEKIVKALVRSGAVRGGKKPGLKFIGEKDPRKGKLPMELAGAKVDHQTLVRSATVWVGKDSLKKTATPKKSPKNMSTHVDTLERGIEPWWREGPVQRLWHKLRGGRG